MTRRVLQLLPPALLRAVGRLQFRYPILRRCALALNGRLTEGDGTIRHGVGAGLRFNAAGGQPGYLLGTSEPREQQLLSCYLGPGGVFYDIGANIGFFSTLAGRMVLPGGSVWAFEPFRASAQQACRNAQLNGFDHVTVVEAAAGRESGRMTLALGEGPTMHRLSRDSEGPTVDVVSIDGWRQRNAAPPPTLVMIDVEGGELDVLEGMIGVLATHRPVVLCEVHWLGQTFQEFVARSLAPLGYGLSALDGAVPEGVERWHAVLLPERALQGAARAERLLRA